MKSGRAETVGIHLKIIPDFYPQVVEQRRLSDVLSPATFQLRVDRRGIVAPSSKDFESILGIL